MKTRHTPAAVRSFSDGVQNSDASLSIKNGTEEARGTPSQGLEAILDVAALLSPSGGNDLLERVDGERVRGALLSLLHVQDVGRVLFVDFRGVRHAGYSALREVLSLFVSPAVYGVTDRYAVFWVDDVASELAEALSHVARDFKIVVPGRDARGNWCLFGRLTLAEAETLAVVRALDGVTSTVASQRMGIGPTAASNRLRDLNGRLLIRREERRSERGGREYIYHRLL